MKKNNPLGDEWLYDEEMYKVFAMVAQQHRNKIPWTSPGEQMAQAMKDSGNSLVPQVHGRVVRISSGGQDWDLSREWKGRELKSFTIKKSAWTKGYTVMYYIDVGTSPGKLHTFTVWFEGNLQPDEVADAAEAYMMALNMRRTE